MAVLAASLLPLYGQHWQMQYLYDKSKSTLSITDLCFASPQRGVAVGNIIEGSHHKPVGLVTSDGGAHWQETSLKEPPVSLFFLNENLGWLVTTKGLWQTAEAGKSWRKAPGPSGLLRVYFTDENNGYAAGTKKRAFETHDGGQHWQSIKAAAEPPGAEKYSAYNWISFPTARFGLITGWNIPPRSFPQQFPDWMEPEEAVSRRETPHLSYNLVTTDGGKSWKTQSASLFGDVTRVRLVANGLGLGLVEHSNGFRYPSEVYKIEWTTGKNETIYRDRKFDVSDIWLAPDGTAWLAGVALRGQIRDVVPGRVQVLMSRAKDYSLWVAQDVDYRAVANRVVLSALDGHNMWLATDSGMILKLVE